MKMKKTLFFILIAGVGIASCKKKEGCTDGVADNFDVEAQVEDNSCTFSGELTVWWNEDYVTTLATYGYTTISVYVDGEFVSSRSASTFWAASPSCGSGISKSFTLGALKSKTATIKIVEGGSSTTADFESEETVTISASDECLSYQWQ